MKIRTGFVSNSSSSSFVICLPRRPTSVEELKSWLFPKNNKTVKAYGEPISTISIARQVFLDVANGEPLTSVEVVEEFSSGFVYDSEVKIPDWPSRYGKSDEEYQTIIREYEDNLIDAARQLADTFVSQNEGMIFFRVSYGDEDGPFFSTMEHGGIFDNISHKKISHL